MPRNENLGIGAKYSNILPTLAAGDKAELRNKFLIEKSAKNEAYHFILAYGLFDLFLDFCKEHRGQDHHDGCVEILLSNIEKQTE